MVPIKNLQNYIDKMNLSMEDKLFFVNKIKCKIFVDYGCADGTLLSKLDAIYSDPTITYIGYDKSEEMLNLAKSKWNGIGKVMFMSNFDDVLQCIHTRFNDTALILSSVLHEVFSQSNYEQAEFWDNINKLPLKYIIIRDMAYNPIIKYSKLDQYLIDKIINIYPKQSSEFVSKFGKFENSLQICHFLLKYRYNINWKRELEEDYFAFDPDIAINYLHNYNFYPIYFERFNVPYIVDRIYEDLRIDLNKFGQTHVKIIFQKQ